MTYSSHARRAAMTFAVLACAFVLPSAHANVPLRGDATVRPHAREDRRARPPGYLSPAPATAAFGLDLFDHLGAGNVVFSPDSVATALAMLGSGAVGPTAQQIATALHLRSPKAFAALGRLQQTIESEQSSTSQGATQPPKLEIANGVFVRQGLPADGPFLLGLERSFDVAGPEAVDFTNPAEAAQTINAWVSAHTQGLIPHAVGPLSTATELALANAIYLKASWLSPFKTNATAPAPFYGSSQQASSVPFMHQTEELPYAQGPGYYALDMPYADSTLSMLVVLPRGGSVERLQRQLTPAMLSQIVHGLSTRPVAVSLPRFHIALQRSLNATLERLGITDAFNSSQADFSGISPTKLVLNEVAHAADMKVDEEGTIAAAATVVSVEATAVRAFRKPVSFDANHPFLFFLRDDHSGALIFAGRLSEAATAQE